MWRDAAGRPRARQRAPTSGDRRFEPRLRHVPHPRCCLRSRQGKRWFLKNNLWENQRPCAPPLPRPQGPAHREEEDCCHRVARRKAGDAAPLCPAGTILTPDGLRQRWQGFPRRHPASSREADPSFPPGNSCLSFPRGSAAPTVPAPGEPGWPPPQTAAPLPSSPPLYSPELFSIFSPSSLTNCFSAPGPTSKWDVTSAPS